MAAERTYAPLYQASEDALRIPATKQTGQTTYHE